MLKNKKIISAIVIFLMISMFASVILLPSTSAHTPTWNIPSYAYLIPAPDPVGIGQKVAIVMWVDTPLPSASVTNDIRRTGYKLTITAPNGATETKTWNIVDDTTSIQYYSYVPNQIGTYKLFFEYAGQTYTWSGQYQNDYFMPTTKNATFTVQEEQLPDPISSYPLPAEYWTRPIEGQNTDWWKVSSNWLGSPYIEGGSGVAGAIQPNGAGPSSAHIMWSRAIQDGGVVGGASYDPIGKTYYMGGSYNVRFSNALIMHGRVYFDESYGNSGGGGSYLCLDLRTGREIWRVNTTGVGVPSFGYLYSYDTGNQHGILPNGLLFTNNFARAYDPRTGVVTTLNITSVPSGTATTGPDGEILRYVLNSTAKTLAQWNSSKMLGSSLSPTNWYSGNVNASAPSNYDWTIPIALGSGTWSINRIAFNQIMLLTQGSFGARGSWTGVNVTAVSLKPESRGTIMWTRNYAAAPGNVSRSIVCWDVDNNVFITEDKETMTHIAWSLTDGSQLWGPTQPANDYNYFRQNTYAAYGNMYFGGYGGELYCYDIKTGDLKWSYGGGGEGNTTKSGLTTAWGAYPIFIDVIADGKIYLAGTEHSPDSPFYKGTRYRCINAYTGEELWTLLGWGTGMDANYDRVADGYLVFLNCYDMKVYSVGKGPSAMTVDAPLNGVKLGDSITIRGTVIDVAAGTKQDEQIARFPYGVPAVSDKSMGPWMEYVYMQKPRPQDTTGVPVVLSVVDANGNYRDIGDVTSDADGFFSLSWVPDIEGKYTVYASFGGSESFWPSHAVTSFTVDPEPATPQPTPTAQASMADTYLLPGIAAIIVVIVIIGALIMLMLRKRP